MAASAFLYAHKVWVHSSNSEILYQISSNVRATHSHFRSPRNDDSFDASISQASIHQPLTNSTGDYCVAMEPSSNNSYDLIVVGSGPAGQKAAICAAKLRKKVAVIERKRTIGGVCVHTGTIPSKTFREAILYLSGLRQRTFYGRGYALKDQISMQDLIFRSDAVMAREIEVIKAQLRRNRVTVYEGNARFLDAHSMEVASDEGFTLLRGHNFVIACGTRPAHDAEIPIDGKRIFDSDQVHDLEELPRELIVVGAGIIGLEYASMFAALG